MLWNWKILVSHVCCASSFLFWIILGTAVVDVMGSQQGIPLSVVKLWASAFGGEIKSISAKYSGSQLLQKKYKELEKSVRVEEIDGMKVVKNLSKKMEEMFRKKKEAIRRLVEAAEEAHLQHEENPELQYEYFNAVLINEVDEEGNNVELGGEFVLEPNEHFNNLSVNLSLSVVQVPTNMYNKGRDTQRPLSIWEYFSSSFYPSPYVCSQYNQEIHYVEPCLNGTLVRADINNKAHFREHLDKLFAKGIGLLGDALTEAFTILNDFNQTGHGSVCSQAIMLVTDGATQMYDDVFAKFNWPDRKVRIFPYLIGRESAFADNMKWMACANKGYFSQISTLADVQENVMRYLHVMSRPKVIDHEHDTVWTEAYMDSTGSIIKGPSLMTTVAMPVFSTKNETVSVCLCILLGVVGTDIPLQELMKIIPKHLLGIHGYAFAITNNGYILTHPDLRPLYQKGQKRRKPNYSSVDLSEVEWEDKDDFLRNAMVNRKTGTFSMEVKKTVDKGKRLLKMHNDYYYTEVKGTPFSVGVALSRGHGKFFFRGNVSVEAGLHDLEQPDVALADEWTYCNTDEHYEHRSLSQIQAIKLYLTGRKPLIKCDRELIQEVLFDAVVTAPLEAYWTGLALNKSENSDKGVEIAYLGTRTGLSRTNLFVVPEDLSNQDFLTAEDKEGVFNADHFPLWYKRAAEQVPGTFVYSIPFGGNENKSVVLASTAIQLLDDRRSPIVASVGIQMNLDFFQKKFWTASRQCAAMDGKCTISCDNEDIKCYLIDNNGFILVTEDYSQTGEFFGEVEAAVMTKLLLIGSFKRINLYDYQALCKEYAGSSDSGYCLSHVKACVFLTMLVPCDTEYPAFVSERTIKETTGNIDCEGCVRSFVIQQIPSSNLFMVVVDNKCDCSSTLPVSMDPIEIMYILVKLKFQKDRKRPESCHPFHPEENAMECGGAAGLSAPLTAALLPLLATLFTR
uniref:Calcium channel, voltage dependent, alpha2/delta subunit 3 n=1 Tax=Hucho hucho TaxID=62062 RepID=A0A4W5RCH3_9TELE